MYSQEKIVNYKGYTFKVVVDGAGLDVVATDDASLKDIKKMVGSVSHDLFCKVLDFGYNKGLTSALENAGAEIISSN